MKKIDREQKIDMLGCCFVHGGCYIFAIMSIVILRILGYTDTETMMDIILIFGVIFVGLTFENAILIKYAPNWAEY